MINMIGEGEMTPEEAAEWMLTKMDEYLTVMERLEPFYDASYEESVRLGGANWKKGNR